MKITVYNNNVRFTHDNINNMTYVFGCTCIINIIIIGFGPRRVQPRKFPKTATNITLFV